MIDEPKMNRPERRRRKKGIYPCMGCGKRQKLDKMESGYCKSCAVKFKDLAKQHGIPPPASIGGLTF